MGSTWIEVIAVIAELMSPVFAGLLAWLSARVATYIKAKVANEAYSTMLARLSDTVFTLVREAEQTAVAEIKRAKDDGSPGGTRLTAEEGAQIKEAVIQKFRRLWGPAGLLRLMRVLGLTDGMLEDFLAAKIEEAIHMEKRAGSK
jgi:hypothetical protein